MSSLASPVAASTSPKIGTSISTPLVVPSPWRTHGDCAKPTTATAVPGPLEVVRIRLIRRVRLAGGAEMVDVRHRRAPLVAGPPDRGHPHAHPDLAGLAAQDQVLERDVGPVEHDRRRDVRRGYPLAPERHVDHAERGHGAAV